MLKCYKTPWAREGLIVRVTIEAEGLLLGEPCSVLIMDAPCTAGQAAGLLPLTRSTGLMILVNGKVARWETLLEDGDVVELIPALGGG